MIIPYRVDVPTDHRPFFNWLIVIGIIVAFIAQTKTIRDNATRFDREKDDFKNLSIEELIKKTDITDEEVKRIEKYVEVDFDYQAKILKKALGKKFNADKLKEIMIEKQILAKYRQDYVWGGIKQFIQDGYGIKGLLGHMWLHADIMHIVGNLIFLWVFGNAVCGKIGNLYYFPAYLVLGLVAALTFNISVGGAVIGASGAINGIVGMYLVMFPLNEISCVYIIMLRPGEFSVSSYWMILLWFVYDIFGAMVGGGGVAYFSHLGGFVAGVGLALLMLRFKLV